MARKKHKLTRNHKEAMVLATIGVSVAVCGVCFFSSLKDALIFGSKKVVENSPVEDIRTAYEIYSDNKDEIRKDCNSEFSAEMASEENLSEESTEDAFLSTLDKANVIRVIDGDTYELKISNKKQKVRLIGVDTPESVAPADYHKSNSEEGKDVSQIVTEKFRNIDTIYVEYDVNHTDKYGRTLAYLYFKDGTMVQDWLLENGYANIATYPPNVKYADHFKELSHTASENRVGLWNGFFEEETQ